VTALNGSSTLRTARSAFSLGVSGLTWGPLRNRANQLIDGGGGQGGSSGAAAGGLLSPGVPVGWTPAKELPASVAAAPTATPAASEAGRTLQGGVLDFERTRACGSGASGSEDAGLSEATSPATACAAAGTSGIGKEHTVRIKATVGNFRRGCLRAALDLPASLRPRSRFFHLSRKSRAPH
jgi:hypothetical protein